MVTSRKVMVERRWKRVTTILTEVGKTVTPRLSCRVATKNRRQRPASIATERSRVRKNEKRPGWVAMRREQAESPAEIGIGIGLAWTRHTWRSKRRMVTLRRTMVRRICLLSWSMSRTTYSRSTSSHEKRQWW
eukprot:Pompholyxophrys_punicea_v1_NODE_28_length_5163_cov_5.731206.p8 type:complete len:133 gc:universal NODE_28_length_5163_cov_5.731206:4864-4466(-)